MRQASKMAGCEDTLEALLKEVGPEGWQEEWSVPVESRMAAISSANLFNIDHMFILVMYCRASKFSFAVTMRFIRDLAIFSMTRNIGRDAQKSFWRSNLQYKAIRAFMHERFEGIYESPFKLTFTRCLRAATCVVPVASDMAPLYVKDKNVGLKMIAKVCSLQWQSGDIKTKSGSTSTSEHLLHQVLLSGMNGTLHMNKNLLKGSALFKVSFEQTQALDRPVPYKANKITPRLCKEFKDQMTKLIDGTDGEVDMISNAFFELVMKNSPFPDVVGSDKATGSKELEFKINTLTMDDMTDALNSLDDGNESIPNYFEPSGLA